ncbi:MAG TPA: alkaline phosphatase family protein [Solirubrobacteraceae bacterium]|nr:alkaline phosphatase family protein [Solirubrobacteraceae bacterium]
MRYVHTIADQLTAEHLTWREYAQDMGNKAHRDGRVMTKNGPACGHPPIGGIDLTDSTGPKDDSYATRHNPFMYFRSIIGHKAYCDTHVVSLTPLGRDLGRISSTPNYSFVTPNTCADGHDWPKCQDGSPGRLRRVDQFLKSWMPRITASPPSHPNMNEVGLYGPGGGRARRPRCHAGRHPARRLLWVTDRLGEPGWTVGGTITCVASSRCRSSSGIGSP